MTFKNKNISVILLNISGEVHYHLTVEIYAKTSYSLNFSIHIISVYWCNISENVLCFTFRQIASISLIPTGVLKRRWRCLKVFQIMDWETGKNDKDSHVVKDEKLQFFFREKADFLTDELLRYIILKSFSGQVEKTMSSHLRCPGFKSACCGSFVLGGGTLSS